MSTLRILLAVLYVAVPSKGTAIKGLDDPITTLPRNGQKLITPAYEEIYHSQGQQAKVWESPLLAAMVPTSPHTRTATLNIVSDSELSFSEDPQSQAPIQTIFPSAQLLNEGPEPDKMSGVWVSRPTGEIVSTDVQQDNENLGLVQGQIDRDGHTSSSDENSDKRPSRDKNGVAENDYMADIVNNIDSLSFSQINFWTSWASSNSNRNPRSRAH